MTITECPRCHARDETEAGILCEPTEDDCPMNCADDWDEALAALNRQQAQQ